MSDIRKDQISIATTQASTQDKSHSMPKVSLVLFTRLVVEVCILSLLSLVIKALWRAVVPQANYIQPLDELSEEHALDSSTVVGGNISDLAYRPTSLASSISTSASHVYGLDHLDSAGSTPIVLVTDFVSVSERPGPLANVSRTTLPRDSLGDIYGLSSSASASPTKLSVLSTGSSSTPSDPQSQTGDKTEAEDTMPLPTAEGTVSKLSKTSRRRRNRRIRLAPYLNKTTTLRLDAISNISSTTAS